MFILKNDLKAVSMAMANPKKDTNINLQGVMIEISGSKLLMIATDSYRIHIVRRYIEDFEEGEQLSFFIPSCHVKSILAVKDKTLSFCLKNGIATVGGVSFEVPKTINYPNWRQVWETPSWTSAVTLETFPHFNSLYVHEATLACMLVSNNERLCRVQVTNPHQGRIMSDNFGALFMAIRNEQENVTFSIK